MQREGKYSNGPGESGKFMHANALKALQSIKWERKTTHVASYEAYMDKWSRKIRTM